MAMHIICLHPFASPIGQRGRKGTNVKWSSSSEIAQPE